MEEGTPIERMRQCELCDKKVKTTKSLINHYLNQHGLGRGDPIVAGLPPSPKKPCQQCGKSVSNPWAHKNTCPKKKMRRDTTSPSPSPNKASSSGTLAPAANPLAPENPLAPAPERLSDDGFLARYRSWLESANGNYAVESTVRDYSRQVLY
jgi:hypothetical protein